MSHVQVTTHYRVEWLLPNQEVRYNEAELYETMSAATAAAEQIKAEVLAPYAKLTRRWLCADYRIAIVEVRRTVQGGA